MELKQQAVSHSIVVHPLFSVLNRKVTYCVFLWDEYTVNIYIFTIEQVWSDGDVVESHATVLH